MPKRFKKATIATAIVAVAGLSLAACASSTPSGGSSSGAKKTFTIGVMINDLTNPFLASVGKAEQGEAAKLGMKIDVLNGNLNNQTEISEVNDLIAKHVDALLLTPSDPTAILPAIAAANAAGIPVVTVNTTADPSAKIISHIGDSDYDYGVGLGNLTVQATGGKGNVEMLRGVLGDSPEVQRLAGFKSVLAKNPGLKLVGTEVDNWVNAKNLADTQDLLAKYPKGQLAAIVAQGPQMYVGAAYAAKQGRSDVKLIAGDYSKEVEAAIKAGSLYGTVDQAPDVEGVDGVLQAYYYLTGAKSKVKANVNIPLPLVTGSNVSKYTATWDS
jgi:ABC-type sugar transport system substrate-binding protein